MKKQIVSILILLLGASLLSGCPQKKKNSLTKFLPLLLLLRPPAPPSPDRPEINVRIAGADYASGSAYTAGTLLEGSSTAAVTVSIQNQGLQDLVLSGTPVVSVTGVNSADFTITQPASTTLAQGENTTFTLTFTPSSPGSRTAALVIQNNDADEGSYTINLNGTGNTNYSLSGGEVEFVANSGNFTYNTTLNDERDVYFIFTNTSAYDGGPSPTKPSFSRVGQGTAPLLSPDAPSRNQTESDGAPVIRHKPEAVDFNNNPPPLVAPSATDPSPGLLPPPPNYEIVGDTFNFSLDTSASQTKAATVRATVAANGWNLVFWVANESWAPSGCTQAACITQEMTNALASSFLNSGTNDDIFEWVTAAVGLPWGSHGYGNLIAGTENTIHILLYDIGADNSQTGGVVGFFWAKDNYLTSAVTGSNQRLMFYIDSVMYATALSSEGAWDINDFWPAIVRGTLAHEFQHMIHFYQRSIVSGAAGDTWSNELASEVVTDLIADKIGIDGPRGLTSADGGSPGITDGRLPRFNYFSDAPVTAWLSSPNTLTSYSVNYAFGAYLLRACGGRQFLRDLVVGNAGLNTAIIDNALASSTACSAWNFNEALRRWAASALLSSHSGNSAPYLYNTGTWSTSAGGGLNFNLGSINLYNYSYSYGVGTQVGPYVYTNPSTPGYYGTSNTIVRAGSRLTGPQSFTLSLPANMLLTVVKKKPDN